MANPGRIVALVLVLLLTACTLVKQGTATVPSTSALSGQVVVYARWVDSKAVGGTSEVPVTDIPVRLYTRDGQWVSSAGTATTDSQGHFAFSSAPAEGVYVLEATLGSRGRLLTMVRLRAGQAGTTVISLASSYLTSYVTRSRLTLAGLDQALFDEIAALTRSVLVEPPLEAIADDDRLAAATDAFLADHPGIKSRLDTMLAGLGIAEGATPAPIGSASASQSPPPASPTPASSPSAPSNLPDPVFTPEPTPPPPGPLDLSQRRTLEVLGSVRLDSPPGGAEIEAPYMVWVSCPASNSIMRLERSLQPGGSSWARSYPISSLLKPTFIPGQIAVLPSSAGAPGPHDPAVWVGNQRSDGTQVAVHSLTGNFLKAIPAGRAPGAVAFDTVTTGRHAWIGAQDGTITVCRPSGDVVASASVFGAVRRIAANTDSMGTPYVWIATSKRLYRVMMTHFDPQTAGLREDDANMVVFENHPEPWLNGELVALCLARDPQNPGTKAPVVLLQRGGDYEVSMVFLPSTLKLEDATYATVPIDARAVGMAEDPSSAGRYWLATENALYRIWGHDIRSWPQTRRMLLFFPGLDYTFFGAYEGPAELVKMVGATAQ